MANQLYAGFVYDDAGAAIVGATVNLFTRNTTTPVQATTTTDSNGYWAITHATEGRFDVEIVNGTSKRRRKYDDQVQFDTLEVATLRVRNPADTFDYDVVPAAIVADRQLTLPLLTATATAVVTPAVQALDMTGFAINTSSGNLTLDPAGEIATTKRYVVTAAAPFRITAGATGPWRSELIMKKGSIGDNVLTNVITVTVPNAAAPGLSAFILVDWFTRTNGDRSSESGQIRVDIARRNGAATAAAIAVTLAGVEQQSGPYAEGLAVTWSIDGMVGEVTATQTFNIEVTVDSDVGGNPDIQAYATVLSGGGASDAEVTIAAAA